MALWQTGKEVFMVLVMYGMVLVVIFLAVAVAAVKDARLAKAGGNKSA